MPDAWCMDVAATSAIAQADTRSRISIAVAKKALDAQRSEGDAAVALLKAAAQASSGSGSAPSDASRRLDVVA